jgi:hypothetical protein
MKESQRYSESYLEFVRESHPQVDIGVSQNTHGKPRSNQKACTLVVLIKWTAF